MKIAKLDLFCNFNKCHKQTQTIQKNDTDFIHRKNNASIPTNTWQAYTINNIEKINFLGKNKQGFKPIYIFMGPPLAGKGTTAKLLSEEKGIPLIGIGDTLRDNIAKDTELGKIAKEYMNSGKLMPSDIIMNMVENRIAQDDCKNGFIFDGFPRKLNEAKDFIEIIERKNNNGSNYSIKVFKFNISEDVLMERAEKRYLEKHRSDDRPEVVKDRIETYKEETKPVEKMFEEMGLLSNINIKSKVGKEVSQESIFNEVLKLTEE